jgi:hypothetical protein
MSLTYRTLMAACTVCACLSTLCVIVGQFDGAILFALCVVFALAAAIFERTRVSKGDNGGGDA